jgi:hypothetical protein
MASVVGSSTIGGIFKFKTCIYQQHIRRRESGSKLLHRYKKFSGGLRGRWHTGSCNDQYQMMKLCMIQLYPDWLDKVFPCILRIQNKHNRSLSHEILS